MLLALCALFVAYVPFTSDHLKTSSQSDMSSFILESAYGQTPDMGSPDPTLADNSTNISNSTGISSGPSNAGDITGPNDTYSNPDTMVPDVSSDLGNPVENTTAPSGAQANGTVNQAVPEFGPVSTLVLTAAIVSIILISAKTGLQFIPRN
jgi:predicted secreted protein with PEFG-CTERM motif